MVSVLSEIDELLESANTVAMTGNPEEALGYYDAVLQLDPANPLALVGKASILKALSRYQECADCFETALAGVSSWSNVSSEDIERRDQFLAMLWVLKAEVLLYLERPDLAIEAVDSADHIRDADAASLIVRGQAYLRQKNFEEAGNCFYRAEEWCNAYEDSMLTQVWLCKLQLAKEAGGKVAPPYAAGMYTRKTGWKKPEGTTEELLDRGNNLRNEGLLYDALRYYDAAIANGAKDIAKILFFKGVIFEQLRQFEDALACYNDALRNEPHQEDEFMIRIRREGCRAERGS